MCDVSVIKKPANVHFIYFERYIVMIRNRITIRFSCAVLTQTWGFLVLQKIIIGGMLCRILS